MKLKKPDFTLYKDRLEWRASFFGWCLVYLSHYFTIPFGIFHKDLFRLFQGFDSMLEIIGFRSSAKSTIGSLAYPLFCSLTKKYKFIILVADTTAQVKLNIFNLRHELEHNALIVNDYGNLIDPDNATQTSLVLTNGVRILGRSRGQKMRGMRHLQYRPDCIVVDDPEDLKWVKTKENRDETERWFNAEVIPAMQETGARLIVIGNFLHTDALMARLKKRGVFTVIEFPLVNEEGVCMWPSKYPTQEALDAQRAKVTETAWLREYLLKVVPDEGAIIKAEQIRKYDFDEFTKGVTEGKIRITKAGAGQDLAIGEKTTNDFTAIVSGLMVKENGVDVLKIKPNPINERADFDKTIELSKGAVRALPLGSRLFVEDVAYQKAAIQVMKKKNLPVTGVTPMSDKRARAEAAMIYVSNGQVHFPTKGCELLLMQLLGFGAEEHDDLVDALVYLILKMFSAGGATAIFEKVDAI